MYLIHLLNHCHMLVISARLNTNQRCIFIKKNLPNFLSPYVVCHYMQANKEILKWQLSLYIEIKKKNCNKYTNR